MVKVEETILPGVGMRYDFNGRFGKRVGVITHRDGRREVFVSLPDDPDATAMTIILTEDESAVVSDLLGGSTVTRRDTKAQKIEGLAMDWLPLESTSPWVNVPLGQTMMRTRTGASIVAIMRGGEAIPSPWPEFPLQAEDTVVVVGTPNGVKRAAQLLRGEPIELPPGHPLEQFQDNG